ncbi:MAG: hypothetical protein ACK41D_10955 [Rubricoccaceae bacterium]
MRSVLTALVALGLALPTAAQHLAVSSTAAPPPGACDFELWGDREVLWVDAQCRPLGALALGLELGRRRILSERAGEPLAALEALAPLRVREGGLSIAARALLGFEERPLGGALRAEALTLLVPASLPLPNERGTLGGHLGYRRLLPSGFNDAVVGVRADVGVAPDVEAFGEAELIGFEGGLHAGIRGALIPDRLTVALGYGVPVRGDGPRRGLTVGIRFGPQAVFPGLR